MPGTVSRRCPGRCHRPDRAQDPTELVEVDLAVAALTRTGDGPLPASDAEIEQQVRRAAAWDDAPVAEERMLAVNALAHAYYQDRLPGTWAQAHLRDRFGVDLTGHPHYAPGYAPGGWTRLRDHLRAAGVDDTELLTTGLATTTRDGRLIDRFRDRVVFPITHPTTGAVLAFIARRNPDTDPQTTPDGVDRAGPKYLNTSDTVLFHKGAQLYGHTPALLDAIPVLVEGPADAIAVTLATGGTHVGLAPLGTGLSAEQAGWLARLPRAGDLVVARDGDLPGHLAAERDYWHLTIHGLDPHTAPLPDGTDPADLLTRRGPAALAAALTRTRPLGDLILAERLTHLTAPRALTEAATVLAARPPTAWDPGSNAIADHLDQPLPAVRSALREAARTWARDRRGVAATQIAFLRDVRARTQAAPSDPVPSDPAPRSPVGGGRHRRPEPGRGRARAPHR